MSENNPSVNDEIVEKVHALQEQIFDLEDEISRLIDTADRPALLSALMEEGENKRRVRHIERLTGDWDSLLARSRAVTDDDLALTAALVRFIGDLLLVQPDGIEEGFLEKLHEYLAEQRAKIS